MSPHRYLWLRRMNLVRCELASTEPVARTVTQIANDYGFGELGRFAVSYRRLSGEAPSMPTSARSNFPTAIFRPSLPVGVA